MMLTVYMFHRGFSHPVQPGLAPVFLDDSPFKTTRSRHARSIRQIWAVMQQQFVENDLTLPKVCGINSRHRASFPVEPSLSIPLDLRFEGVFFLASEN